MKKFFYPPVKRIAAQVITSPFGKRIINGKENFHYAVDLRTIRFPGEPGDVGKWNLQKIQATEKSVVLRTGKDEKGNNYIVLKPLTHLNFEEIGYIHIGLSGSFYPNEIIDGGCFLGYSEIGGSSKAHHLHFFVKNYAGFIDPIHYLNTIGVKYKFKDKK